MKIFVLEVIKLLSLYQSIPPKILRLRDFGTSDIKTLQRPTAFKDLPLQIPKKYIQENENFKKLWTLENFQEKISEVIKNTETHFCSQLFKNYFLQARFSVRKIWIF